MNYIQGYLNQLFSEILDIIKAYTYALNILDDYDHQQIKKPAGTKDVYVLEYNECKQIISKMRFTKDSNIFGVEKEAMVALVMNFLEFGEKEVGL